ncbi:MAG: c-type cytochrome [Acidimicrobiia bacterium]
MPSPLHLTLIFGFALALAACGDTDTALSPEDRLRLGETMYGTACAACHGDALEGTLLGPPLDDLDRFTDEDLARIITRGVGDGSDWPPMPGTRLRPNQVDAVITWVRTQG